MSIIWFPLFWSWGHCQNRDSSSHLLNLFVLGKFKFTGWNFITGSKLGIVCKYEKFSFTTSLVGQSASGPLVNFCNRLLFIFLTRNIIPSLSPSPHFSHRTPLNPRLSAQRPRPPNLYTPFSLRQISLFLLHLPRVLLSICLLQAICHITPPYNLWSGVHLSGFRFRGSVTLARKVFTNGLGNSWRASGMNNPNSLGGLPMGPQQPQRQQFTVPVQNPLVQGMPVSIDFSWQGSVPNETRENMVRQLYVYPSNLLSAQLTL